MKKIPDISEKNFVSDKLKNDEIYERRKPVSRKIDKLQSFMGKFYAKFDDASCNFVRVSLAEYVIRRQKIEIKFPKRSYEGILVIFFVQTVDPPAASVFRLWTSFLRGICNDDWL